MKRTALKRSTTPMKRTSIQRASTWAKRKPLAKVSLKRLATLPARRRCVEIVHERDKVCQFWVHEAGLLSTLELVQAGECWGPLDVHEPGHRSQGADPTDPDAAILLCRGHHDFAHREPRLAKGLGI